MSYTKKLSRPFKENKGSGKTTVSGEQDQQLGAPLGRRCALVRMLVFSFHLRSFSRKWLRWIDSGFLSEGFPVQTCSVADPLLWSSLFVVFTFFPFNVVTLTQIYIFLTLCEATARSTKLRKMQSYKSVFYQKKEALLLITTLPCLKVFVSLITKSKSKSSWHTEKFAKSRLKKEVIRKSAYKAPKPQRVLLPALLLKFSRSLTNFQASPGRQSSL